MFTISKNNIKKLFYYNDGQLFWKIKPSYRVKKGQKAGTIGNDGYEHIGIFGKIYMSHRIIFLYHYGYLPKFIDHINGNKLDNKIENLRVANINENQYNSKIRKDNISGVKGVSWYKRYNKWRAQCKVEGKTINLGYFNDIKEASMIVKKFREENHGIFFNHG